MAYLSAFLFFCTTLVFSQKPEWKFIKETKGIKVYYREIPNRSLNEVKIQTTFDCSLSTIVEALRDVDSYPKWVYKAAYSKKVKQISMSEMIYYNKLDFPWPLSDRDVCIRTKVSQNLQTKEVISVSYAVEEALEEDPNQIRIKEFNSKWTFTPTGNTIKGEYVFSSNPGGAIPIWLVNASLEDGPIKTIQNLKKVLTEKQYIKNNELAILN
ncbi:START domain-containing protein [Lacihabitans sp. LS3-19]|uniref:START domain-containing protein n=1 Tax=Lacihabitans sp. LS3-19 TaxID=2487335 RepID=UPI0020CB6F27|nr:START domain-containing protein [Lacihabitans sp. LS3-19]